MQTDFYHGLPGWILGPSSVGSPKLSHGSMHIATRRQRSTATRSCSTCTCYPLGGHGGSATSIGWPFNRVSDRCRKGIGWQVARNSWTLLSSILESAVEYGYLESNPARGVKFRQQGLKQKPAMIAGDDCVKLLRQLSEPHGTMVSLIAATGLRVGELLALRWGALDLVVGTLAVRESVFEGRFQAPKTQRAMRTIPLGPRVVKLLGVSRADWSPGVRRSCVRPPEGQAISGVEAVDASAATGSG